jgi:hypothetical protein
MKENRIKPITELVYAFSLVLILLAVFFIWANSAKDKTIMETGEITKECVVEVKEYSPGEINTMQTDYIYEYTLSPSGNRGKSRVPVSVGDTFYFHQVILKKCEE